MKQYAILGPEGTFTEEALYLHCAHPESVIYANNIHTVFELVEEGDAAAGLVPLWNSQAGSIPGTIRRLIETPLYIQGEVAMKVSHAVIGNPGTSLDDIELLISQPAVFLQCENYIRHHMPAARREIVDSTARAAALVRVEKKPAAAIGPRRMAEVYGLTVLAEEVEDCADNCTVFARIGRQMNPEAADKTTILFCLREEPGALYTALGTFAKRKINLTRLESRPRSPGVADYMFIADIEGGIASSHIEEALDELRQMSSCYKFLGSYRADTKTCGG